MWILFLILWLLFGSLGSVVMTRFADWINKKNLRGFFFGRSECPHCQHKLHAKNLIPLVSYLVQWGKCAYCKQKISRIYPVLEILSGMIFVATYFFLKNFWIETLVVWLLANWLLVILLVYDLQKYELHMIARILLLTLGTIANINLSGGSDGNFLMSTLMFGVTFWLIYLFAKRYVTMRFKKHEEWFGQGDIFLAVSIGTLFPLVLSLHQLSFSWMMIANVLILFVLLSSIVGLIRAWIQYLLHWQLIMNNWKWNVNSQFSILHSQSKVIPFFPAMIIAFWILARKLPFFISLILPLAW